MVAKLDPQNYFRLPFTLTDNALSWVEVTTRCNLNCEGCYRDTHSPDGHKTLAEVEEDLKVFKRERSSDSMSIAGGDPLVHPQIVEIVAMVKRFGWKPIINTNGLALTEQMLADLVRAGVFGFTFHIDISQPGRTDAPFAKNELDLCPLRLKFAEMCARAEVTCSFNQTVTADTLDQVPSVVEWAEKHPDIVHSVVFILYREPEFFGGKFEYFANGQRIAVQDEYKKADGSWKGQHSTTAHDVVAKIREADPEYEPCAYLGGTVNPRTFKWLLASRIANRQRGFGFVSPKVMETIQQVHHLLHGTYIAYSDLKSIGMGRTSLLAFSTFDRKMRRSAWRFLKNAVRHPRELFEKAYSQTILVIQPIDLLDDGRADMCDGCPDITVHEGKLYWSCRLEEIKQHGCFVTAVPKSRCRSVRATAAAAAAAASLKQPA